MQRIVGTVLVVMLVILAGCSGVFDGGSDGPVETFTPVPDPTPKPTSTPAPQLAPGLTGQGIKNASVLIAAHTSFLQNHSFTEKSNYMVLAANGSVILRGTSTLRVGPPGKGVYSISKLNRSYEYPNSEPVRTEAWSNGERLFLKRTYANGTTTYDRSRMRNGYGISGLRFLILRSFGVSNTSVVKRFTKNGTRLYRVQGTTRVDQTTRGNESISLQLLVDSRGVIHEYQIVRRLPSEKNISPVYETQFSNIGATDVPEQPSWVDEAINQTTPISEGNSTSTMPAIRQFSTASV